MADLPDSPTPTFRADTTFLLGVVTGSHSLYRYNTGGREYFYIEQQGKFDLLIYKRFRLPSSPTIVRPNTTYREQLTEYLAGCSAIGPQLKMADYTLSSLRRAFTAYLACTHQPAAVLKRKVSSQVGLLAGVTHSTLAFTADYPAVAPNFTDQTTFGPTGGLYLYLSVPGSLQRFSINNELTFNAYKASNSNTKFTSADNYEVAHTSLELSYLKLNTLLRFTQPVGTGSIFVNIGISNGYAFRANSEQSVFRKFYTSEETTTKDAFDFRRYEQGYLVGVGGSIKRLSAEARYEQSNGFLDTIFLDSSFKRYSLLIGYRLF